MLKQLAFAAAAVAAVVSTPVAAQSFGPPGTYVLSGPVTIHSTHSTTCTVTINVAVSLAGAATVTSRSLSGGAGCGPLAAPYGTWMLAPGPGSGAVTLTMGVSPAHNCYGAVQASLTVMPTYSRIDLPFAYLPLIGSAGNGCAIATGSTLYSNAPLSVIP